MKYGWTINSVQLLGRRNVPYRKRVYYASISIKVEFAFLNKGC